MTRLKARRSTPTQCVTLVNSAFLQEIKESLPDLRVLIQQVRRNGENGGNDECAAVAFVDGLQQLRDSLRQSFELEETYGYITTSRSIYRPVDDRADQARIQHRELFIMVHEIAEQAEEAQYRGTLSRDLPLLGGAVDCFESRWQDHEALEQELIADGLGMGRLI
ncbi:MAG: hypothetical protein KatS3mg111_4114 [Pirellulaceae bacterium]|nr:MAG: hypothetical protein KatS3mg111_4114 [Pirellulaceae bacterium]